MGNRGAFFCLHKSLLHGKSEKQEKFCRIFVLINVQKHIFEVYF